MQPEPDEVPSLLEQIRETYERLDGWRARSATIEDPQPGSELHGDATIWPGMPPHEVARVGLISAVQHLNLGRAALEHGEIYPIAHPSVLRGALLGAARAVWLLAPDDRHERQQRALRTIHETHRRLLQYARTEGAVLASPGEATGALEYLAGRVTTIRELWRETPTMSAKHSPSETDIVAMAAQAAITKPGQRLAVPILWAQLSGDAHGLPWPMLTRRSTQAVALSRRPGESLRMAEFSAGGDIEEVAECFLAAYGLLRRGWSLFDQRCEAP